MNFFKLKFLLLFFALAVAIPPAWAETVTLTLTDFPDLTGSYSSGSITKDGITYQYTDFIKSNGSIQTKANTGALYNSIAFPGDITSVAISHTGTARSTTISGSSDGENWTPVVDGSGSITGDFSKKGYKYFKITRGSNAAYWSSIVITYETGGSTTEKVATPTFSPAGGNYTEAQNVTISCATDGATIHYTTDGTEPTAESPVYSTAITVGETMTIKAIAMKDGMDNSAIASATYTLPTVVTNLAEANKLDKGTKFVYNGYAEVTFVNGSDIWIRDGAGTGGYLYRASTGFANGDVLAAGWVASRDEFNGLIEYSSASGLKKSGDATVNPVVLQLAEITKADMNKYVRLENVTGDDFTTTVQWYDKFKNGLVLTQGKTYNVEGIVGYYNGLQFYPITVEVVETPGVPEITVDEETLTINDKDENNTFTVTGSNLIDNVGVTASEGFSTNVNYLEYNSGSAEGTVKVTYTGRDLHAEGTVVMGTDKDDTGEDITETVNVTYQPEIYLYGDLSDNNHDDWGDIADGKMERNGDVYSKTITLNEKGFLLFARKTGETYGWDKNRLFFGPKTTDGNNWLYVADKEDDLDLDPSGQYHPFELPAGTYTITINAETKKFNIAKTEPINACPAVIEFADNTNESGDPADSTTAFSGLDKFLESVSSGQGFIQGVTIDKVYAGKHGIKFGTSKNGGNLTIDLKSLNGNGSWRTTKVIVNAMQYEKSAGVYEQSNIIVNNTSIALTNELTDHEFVFDGSEISSLKVSSTARMYVKSITIMHECGDEPVIPELAVSLPEVPSEHYKVGQEVKVKATVENGSENTVVTYKIGEGDWQSYPEGGIVLPNTAAGDVVVTVKATDGDRTANDSKTYVFDAAEELTITLNPANGEYYVGAEAKVNVTVDKAITTNPTITYKFGEEVEAQTYTYNAETGIVLPTAEAGTINLTVTVDDNGYEHTGANTATGTYTVKNKPLTITLDPASGEYTVGKEAKVKVTIENVVGESDVEYVASYTVNDEVKKQKLTANEGYVTLPNDKAVTYTLTVTALDERMEEVTATGTYKFNAAPAFDITLTPNKEGNYTVGENAVVTVAVDKYIDEDYLVTYTIGDGEEQIEYNAQTGIVLPNDKAGDVTVKVYVTDGYDHEGEGTATATYHFDAAPAIVVTLTPAEGSYTVGTEVKVNVKIENTIGDYLATYTINDGEEQEFDGNDIVIPSDQIATVTLAVSVTDAYHDGVTTVTGQYVFSPMPVVAMPTFSLVAGSYTGPQQVIINCATEGATISYSTDGGSTWTVGNTVNVDKDMTIMAKAEKDGMTVSTTASATYVIITEEAPVTVNIETGYYQIKNLGNDQYANVAGRKTLNFTSAPDDKAGTVIYVDVENDGTVKSLRSQAADLQRYADRAMSYVPEVVKIVAQKLNADGSGEILGETGLEKILEKFNKCFDHNLHVEQAEGGYRLYGKTPSMQPVVEFYRENKDKVEAKLPNLEAFINSALEKLKAKIGGSSVFTEFKLHDIWDKMGGTLTEPVDAASTMAFYREVLNNKNYVWDFAYQTAMIYVNNLMNHPRWSEVEEQLGEYAQYIDKIKQIRPEFKYYIVQKDGKPDFISEGNKDIIDNAERTIWTLEPRTGFTVNFPEANKHNGEYVTTLYTDFAYTLPPEGVTAYTVTEVSTQGVATLTALEGTIPAQTPVLLKSTAAGPQTVTLSTEAGTAPADNLLVGPDYLIKHYEFKTPQVVDIFNYIKDKLPGFYEEYVAQYEYLMLKTAGTVGNKYFWNVNSDLDDLKDDCIVRSLAVDENGTLAFSDHWTTETNKAFLVDDANNPQDVIKLPSLRGDINKDGVISIIDVTALIDILLDLPARTYLNPTDTYPNGLDYEAADVNENKDIEITDVTTLIDILLNMPDQPAQGSGN